VNRARKLARQHVNGDAKRHANLETKTAVVVDELITVTGPVRPAHGAPVGLLCDLSEFCAKFVTHEVPVRVNGRDAQVFGCEAHAVAWAVEANAPMDEDDDG
jgi:hypothetical protein